MVELKECNSESQPFLDNDSERSPQKAHLTWKPTIPIFIASLQFALGLQAILIVLYASLGIYRYIQPSGDLLWRPQLLFPGRDLKSEPRFFVLAEKSRYAGEPSSDLDSAWDQLMAGMNLRATKGELALQNQSSITLLNGQDELVWVEAFHQLHCVKWLRQWIYREYYHPQLNRSDIPHWMLHADHCLELLRQAVMCKPDTSLMTFEWKPEEARPLLKLAGPMHECMDWTDLTKKLEPRRISDQEMRELVNPLNT